jgi:pimeloyl-ACP methyl ester carboxylesterase
MHLDTIPRDKYIQLKNGAFHYMEWETGGLPAHFLHANGMCAGTYTPFIKLLSRDLHVIASDIRGHGDSARIHPSELDHWRSFSEDLRDITEALADPPIIGIGHSLGAVLTYMAAALYPHLFSCIILIDPVMLPGRWLWLMRILQMLGLENRLPLAQAARRRKKQFDSKQAAFERFSSGRGIFKAWPNEFISAYLECALAEKGDSAVLKCDPELEARLFESVPQDEWSYARKIQCPTLAIRGEHSDTFFPDAARKLGRLIRNYQLETIANAGHFVPMEQPETCAALILEYASQHHREAAVSS